MTQQKRSPQDEIKFWLNPLLTGIDSLNEFMNGVELFNCPNNLRVHVLIFFAMIQLQHMSEVFNTLDLRETFKIFLNEFSNMTDSHPALNSCLLAMMNIHLNELKNR